MKKIGLVSIVLGIILLGTGIFLMVNDTGEKGESLIDNKGDNTSNESNSTVEEKHKSLQEVDSYVVKNEMALYLNNFKTRIEEDKYIISCTESEDVNSQLFEFEYGYKDDVLSGSIGGEYTLEEYVFFGIILNSVALADGYTEKEASDGAGFVWYMDNDYETNGYEVVTNDNVIDFRINLANKIKLYTADEMYITSTFLEGVSVIKSGERNHAYSADIGNFKFYYENDNVFICEKNNRTENSYKSVLEFIEFYYGNNFKDEYQNKYSSLVDSNFYSLVIDTDYNGDLYSKDGYIITRIEIKRN